ncbi:organic cation transporter protein-like [Styela clava]
MLDFDVILDHVGNFGRYQAVLCIMIYYLICSTSMHMFAPVFYAYSTPHRCRFPQIDDPHTFSDLNENDILNLTTPFDEKSSEYDTCHRYSYNLSQCHSVIQCIIKNNTERCLDGHVFDRFDFVETTVSEWHLICDRDYLNTLESSLYFVGMMIGGLVVGFLADRFGRKPVLLLCCMGIMIFGTISSVVPWFPLFVVTRFLVGICTNGQDFVAQVYVMEVTGRKHTTASLMGQAAFGIGIMINSFFAYFIREWRYFYLALSLFPAPFLIFCYFIPESPRWHISKSQDEIGKKMAINFAKRNGKEITEAVWNKAEMPIEEIGETFTEKYSALDLFKGRRIRFVTICVNICWFMTWLTSIGLSLNVGNVAGDIYFNNALNGIISLVCSILLIFVVDRISRRYLLGGSMLLTASSGLGNFFVIYFGNHISALETVSRVLTFVAYIGSWIVVVVLFMYTAELYPTVVRSNGLGVSTVAASLGSILAPIVISTSHLWLPSLMFGLLSIIAGALFFRLPETINRPMTETLEEADHFYAGRSTLRQKQSNLFSHSVLSVVSDSELTTTQSS